MGPFYFATQAVSQRRVPVHTVGIHQMEPPWRRGRAVMFPVFPWFAFVIGFWRKWDTEVLDEELAEEAWLGPAEVITEPFQISTWWRGPDEDETESVNGDMPGVTGVGGQAFGDVEEEEFVE